MAIDMTKTVILLAVPGVQLLDVSGPLDVFAEANVQAGRAAYRTFVVATEPGPIPQRRGGALPPARGGGGGPQQKPSPPPRRGSPPQPQISPQPSRARLA